MANCKFYGNTHLKAYSKEIDWLNDDIKVMLCTSDYTPDQDIHEYKNDVTNEVSGTGYTAGGISLSGKTLTYDSANNKVMFNSDNPLWINSTITARYSIIYDNTPVTDDIKPLLGWVDFGEDKSSVEGSLELQWNGTNIFEIIST